MLAVMEPNTESPHDPASEFLVTGRTGRRNAMADILGPNATTSSADLPERLQSLCTVGECRVTIVPRMKFRFNTSHIFRRRGGQVRRKPEEGSRETGQFFHLESRLWRGEEAHRQQLKKGNVRFFSHFYVESNRAD